MSCSISAAGKSASNWLDRLRSSKGFPSSSGLDLDRFLACQNHDPTAETVHPNHPQEDPPLNLDQTSYAQSPSGDRQLSRIISNALSELFVMGDSIQMSTLLPGKKCSRKQPNPRFCAALNSSDSDNTNCLSGEIGTRKNESASPVSDDNSGVGLLKEMTNSDEQVRLLENVKCAQDDNEEKGRLNLAGFSRTEVTVIDTSFAGWKSEKMLFRKNNIWKARDKTSKCAVKLGKKKRKACAMANKNDDPCEVKKLKVFPLQGGVIKNGSSEPCSGEYYHGDKLQAAGTKMSGAVPKSPKKKQGTSNLVEGSSSVVLGKSVPTSNKSGTSFPGSCTNLSYKQTND